MPHMASFLSYIFHLPIGVLAVLSAIALMLINGWTDAPVGIASAVGSRALSFKKATVLSSVCNCLGAVAVGLLGNSVAKSVTELSGFNGLPPKLGAVSFTAAMLSVAVWSLLSLFVGIPTSESHALLAALSGAAMAVTGINSLNVGEWSKVLLGLVISSVPLVVLSKKVTAILKKRCGEKSDAKFKKMLIVGAGMSAFAHGAQDGQKFAGVFALQIALLSGKQSSHTVPFYAVLISAVFISIGMLLGGKKIVGTLTELSSRDALSGFSADLVSAFALLVMSLVGIPASTTAAKTSALIGTGNSNIKGATKLFATWVLTFPACGFLGFVISKLLLLAV